MDCTIRVFNEETQEIYTKEFCGVTDPRQIMNKLRRAKNIIEKPSVSTVHIAGDKNPFRIPGREEDVELWLKQRIKSFKAVKMPEEKDNGNEI
jgi:hypothetical protein